MAALTVLAVSCATSRQIDGIIADGIREGTMPGAVVCVVKGEKITFLKAYGNRQIVPDTLAMTTETVFDLASVSKCVGTTLSIMQLVEQGRLSLEDRVDRYIPGFVNWEDEGGQVPIIVRDLLTHSSGLQKYVNPEPYLQEHPLADADSLIHYIATGLPRRFRPGTEKQYSCLNFITLQHILESITGERLCDYAQKHVFDVLGLQHTCYFPESAPAPEGIDCAATEVQPDGHVLLGEVHDPLARIFNKGNSGNAGVFSNARDLATIAMALMNGGELNGKRILKEETVRKMFTVPPENAPSIARALGWDTYGPDIVGHSGYTGTSIRMNLKTHTAVIILANRVHPRDDGSMDAVRTGIANFIILQRNF